MPKFLFTLQTLLRHREDVEEKARDELFRISYKQQLEQNRRDLLRARFEETTADLAAARAKDAGSRELDWYFLYLKRLTKEIEESNRRLEVLNSEVQAQKEAVIEASKKRKTLDLMKKKKARQFVLALEKQEQKEVDELVATRFAGREPEGERPQGRLQNKSIGRQTE